MGTNGHAYDELRMDCFEPVVWRLLDDGRGQRPSTNDIGLAGFGLTASQLRRRLRMTGRMSLRDVVTYCCLTHAQALIRDGMKVEAAMRMSGFRHVGNFCDQFRLFFGCQPHECRERAAMFAPSPDASRSDSARPDVETEPAPIDRHHPDDRVPPFAMAVAIRAIIRRSLRVRESRPTLAEVSDELHMTSAAIRRALWRECHTSFREETVNAAVTFAAEMISAGTKVTAAARAAGFRNRTNFVRQFQRRIGCLPSQLRDQAAATLRR